MVGPLVTLEQHQRANHDVGSPPHEPEAGPAWPGAASGELGWPGAGSVWPGAGSVWPGAGSVWPAGPGTDTVPRVPWPAWVRVVPPPGPRGSWAMPPAAPAPISG